jgi:hypothetical protein
VQVVGKVKRAGRQGIQLISSDLPAGHSFLGCRGEYTSDSTSPRDP